MTDIIHHDQSLLLIITRFGLNLGFGDKTVAEVCEQNNIDSTTFLRILNFLGNDNFKQTQVFDDVSLPSVISFLRNSHSYFLDFKLPSIRKKLVSAVSNQKSEIDYSKIYLKFFDDYVREVKKHMAYENKTVFPYALSLIEGDVQTVYNIGIYKKKHHEIDSTLAELKNILIKYFPDKGDNYLLTEVLFDILSCEKELNLHNRVEDYFFSPAIEALEKHLFVK
jgi:regulator of cell morphogenesis and NO signaling